MSFIQNLQKKSENQKRIIMFFAVGFLMVLVFIIWFFQFKNSYNGKTKKSDKILIPVTELTENVVNTYKNSTEEIEKIKEIFNEIE